jgi:hypothetical protein
MLAADAEGCCAEGMVTVDGRCCPSEAASDNDVCCPAGTLADGAGDCQPAGVSACPSGFTASADGGCDAVLPGAPCGAGLMAAPGDTACREVAPCGTGTWGNIPIDSDTEHVDPAYQGGNSDGSLQAPWTNIGQALATAQPGAIVALAAGSYAAFSHQDKPVRIWGRCPSMVEVSGATSGPGGAAILIQGGASGTEIRDLAVTGPIFGIGSIGSAIRVERVWVHDTGWRGIHTDTLLGPARIDVVGSLVERAAGAGMSNHGETVLTVTASEVRGIGPGMFLSGVGVYAVWDEEMPELTVSNSVISNAQGLGIGAFGAVFSASGVAIHDIQTDMNGAFGRGIDIEEWTDTATMTTATISGAVIERVFETGIFSSGSDVTIADTTIRDVVPSVVDKGGVGMSAQLNPNTDTPTRATFARSMVTRTHDVGIAVVGANADISRLLIRDTSANALGQFGDGLTVQTYYTRPVSSVTLEGSVIQNSSRAAISSFGGDVAIDRVLLDCNAIDIAAEIELGGNIGLDRPPEYDNVGGNVCSCASEVWACASVSSGLAPPAPP